MTINGSPRLRPKIVALIPLRGGSQRIPGKNIKIMAGRPLAHWVCQAAATARFIDQVYVSTENDEIRRTVQSFGLNVHIVSRPAALAQDASSTDEVLLHFMTQVEFDIVATLQATSPLTSAQDLDSAIERFLESKNDSMLTGVRFNRFVWSADGRPLNYDPFQRPLSQNFAGSVFENGAFYLTWRHILETHRNRLGGKIGIFEMDQRTAVEIDTPDDWKEVERLLTDRPNGLLHKAGEIRVVITDFDGVWTDNKVFTFADFSEAVCSSKLDSLGLDLFRSRCDLPVLVVSKERHPVLLSRCAKLKLDVLACVDDKVSAIEAELRRRSLSWSQVCFAGNDLNDIGCMEKARLSFCPSDAVPEVKVHADYILSKPGGNGAVREMLELLVKPHD